MLWPLDPHYHLKVTSIYQQQLLPWTSFLRTQSMGISSVDQRSKRAVEPNILYLVLTNRCLEGYSRNWRWQKLHSHFSPKNQISIREWFKLNSRFFISKHQRRSEILFSNHFSSSGGFQTQGYRSKRASNLDIEFSGYDCVRFLLYYSEIDWKNW